MLEINYEFALCKDQIQPMFWKLGLHVLSFVLLGSSAPVSYSTYLEFFCILYHFKDRNTNILAFPELTVCVCVRVCVSVCMHHWNFLDSNAVFSCQTPLWVFLNSRHFFNSNLKILRENRRSFSKTGCQEDRNWMVLAGHETPCKSRMQCGP